MNQKIQKIKSPAKTFLSGRACLYCGEPIEDQARLSKKYCTPWIDEYGINHYCRRKQHHIRHAEDENILLDYNAKQRETKRQIESLIKTHGNKVTKAMLDAFGIELSSALEQNGTTGAAESKFLGYSIISKAYSNHHKIIKHD